MIIECINCNKKFIVNSDLIPTEGRNIQCGSCNYIWFFKPDKIKKINLKKIENIDENTEFYKDDKFINDKTENKKEKKIDYNKAKKYQLTKYKRNSNFTVTKFLSYLVVSLISFIAFIVIIDTFKKPLYSNFLFLELMMFNLFETLTDVKLFVKDLL